jgi:hypothetical protein
MFRKSKSLKIYVRDSVIRNLTVYLTLHNSSLKMDKFLWILSKIDFILDKDSRVYKGLSMIPISSVILRDEIGERYREYLDILMDAGIIDSDNFYITPKNGGECSKCKCYGYTKKYVNNKLVPYYVNNKALIKKKDAWLSKQKNLVSSNENIKFLYDKLIQVKIDIISAQGYLGSKLKQGEITDYEYHLELLKCNRINDGDFYIKQDDYGRVHSNLTSISKNIRERFLYIDNKRLVGIDIKSSQPAILASIISEFLTDLNKNVNDSSIYVDPRDKYMSKKNSKGSFIPFLDNITIESPVDVNCDVFTYIDYIELLSTELELYSNTIKNGVYESFQVDWFNQYKEEITIKQAKKLWYQFAFGKTHTPKYKQCRAIWSKNFPFIVDLIERIKADSHKTMAHLLQRRESKIVIDNLCHEFSETVDSRYFTVHDCLYFIHEDSLIEKGKQCFMNILRKFNVPTTISLT